MVWALDLDSIVEGLPAMHATFPMRYLGLTLSVWQLKRINYEYLRDKVVLKLVPWEGLDITSVGHRAIVKSVLTSRTIHHIMFLVVPSPALKSINKIERLFLWAGTNKVIVGKCKVNCETFFQA